MKAAPLFKVTDILENIEFKHRNQKKIYVHVLIKELNGITIKGMIFIISLCFSFPIPLPFISSIFGIILISLGIKMIISKKLWFPKWFMMKEINYETLVKLIFYSKKVFLFLEKFLSNRWNFLIKNPIFNIINALVICFQGFLLALPLPVPFTNIFAAFPIMILSIGLLEEDGLLILISYFFSLMSTLFFLFLFLGIKEVINLI